MPALVSFSSFSDELLKISQAPVSANDKVFQLLRKGSPVKVRITSEAEHYGGGFFDMEKKEIGVSEKDFKVLAHEVGHAHLHERLLGRLIQNQAVRAASSPGLFMNLAALGAGLLVAKGKKWGLLLPTLVAVPTLLSEGLATRKGGKLLEEAGATSKQRKDYHSNMRRGFATYLAGPAIGTLVAGGIALGSR